MNLTDKQVVEKLGLQLKAIRKRKGMTQLQVADLCEIEESAYRRVENAGTSPTLKTLLAIARAFDVSLLDLFEFMKHED